MLCDCRAHPNLQKPNCSLENVVYSIVCNTCRKEYGGETQRPARDRFTEHSNPNEKRGTDASDGHEPSAVALHCIEAHDGNFDLSMGLVGRAKSHAHRKCLEGVYVKYNNCLLNRQLNDGGVQINQNA